eukprot:1152171-Pelagomonas_calceolata.AAC.6
MGRLAQQKCSAVAMQPQQPATTYVWCSKRQTHSLSASTTWPVVLASGRSSCRWVSKAVVTADTLRIALCLKVVMHGGWAGYAQAAT